MKRKLLQCAFLALAAGSSPSADCAQSTAEEAKQWLGRMIQATHALNYEGTFIYVQGPHVEAMRVVHGGGPENERQRLFSLNGAPREILLANDSITCVLPRQHATFAGDGYQRSRFPLSIPRELGQLESHYDFAVLGDDRVAGLEARVVAIQPRDAWRFGYRLWLDRQNGMLLRSVLLDDKDYPVEQLMFTDLQIKSQIDETAFGSSLLPGETVLSTPTEGAQLPVGAPVAQSAWSVLHLPVGFVKISHNRFPGGSGRHPTEHMVFADGLATVSVFLERLDGAAPLLQGASQLGSMNAFGAKVGDYQVLVVGEVPAATVEHIAASVSYNPEVANSSTEESKQ